MKGFQIPGRPPTSQVIDVTVKSRYIACYEVKLEMLNEGYLADYYTRK